jgi:signal transduction histidine kinase
VIFNSVGTLKRLLKPSGDVDLLLGIIGEEADRLNRMVGDLLDYSRPLQPALQPVPLKPLIEEALESARKQTGTLADVVKQKVSVANGLPPLRADSRLLRQALVNLFLNALQAMPKGGELRVRADAATVAGQPAAQIVIRDTGPGVPPDARQRIFQPFFTTKATGTGLGLAVVKRIIEGHRGDIALADATPGAEFRLRIPLDG